MRATGSRLAAAALVLLLTTAAQVQAQSAPRPGGPLPPPALGGGPAGGPAPKPGAGGPQGPLAAGLAGLPMAAAASRPGGAAPLAAAGAAAGAAPPLRGAANTTMPPGGLMPMLPIAGAAASSKPALPGPLAAAAAARPGAAGAGLAAAAGAAGAASKPGSPARPAAAAPPMDDNGPPPAAAAGPSATKAAAGGPDAAAGGPAAGSKTGAAKPADPPGSLLALLGQEAPLFRSLFDVLNITARDMGGTALVGTFFAPNDKAVGAFLKAMGLTAKELAARPELVDLMVSYHFVPGYQLAGASALGRSSKVAATGDDQYIVRLGRKSGKLVVSDVQRSRARAVTGPLTPKDVPGVNVFVMDSVLRSGNYFPNISAALLHSPYFITTRGLVEKAGILPLLGSNASATLLVPTNSAFKPLESELERFSTARVADILRYHTLPKVRVVPDGFQPDGSLATLLSGHKLRVKVDMSNEEKDPFSGSRTVVPRVTLTPEVGPAARIVMTNLFAGRSVLQGVDGVLLPDLPADTKAAATSAAEQQPPEDGPGADAPSVLDANGKLRGPEATGSVATKPAAGAAGAAEEDPLMPPGGGDDAVPPVGVRKRGARAGRLGGMMGPNPSNSLGGAAGTAQDDTNAPGDAGMAGRAGRMGAAAPRRNRSSTLMPLIKPRLSGRPDTPPLLPGGAAAGGGVVEEAGPARPGPMLPAPQVAARRQGVLPGGTMAGGPAMLPGGVASGSATAADGTAAGPLRPPGRPLTPPLMTPVMNPGGPGGRLGAAASSLRGSPAAVGPLAPGGSSDEPGRHHRLRRLLAAAARTLLQPVGTPAATMAIGSVGSLQTFANGIGTDKTRTALRLAAEIKGGIPRQYSSRYGTFGSPTAKGGCLNCRVWAEEQ